MDKTKFIKKIALYLAAAMFAGWSAFFTTTSLSLTLLHTDNFVSFIFVYVLVFIVAIMASWCLTLAITEVQKTHHASKTIFTLSVIGFLILWALSFTTNVHYFFVEKHGLNIARAELNRAKEYINEHTEESNRIIEEQKRDARESVQAKVTTEHEKFDIEIESTLTHNYGFGNNCIGILQNIENILKNSNSLYEDKNTYVIYDPNNDRGDYGTKNKTKINNLQKKYGDRIGQSLNKKLKVIDAYYNKEKKTNTTLSEILESINKIDQDNQYTKAAQDGSANAYFKLQDYQQTVVINNMPPDFKKVNVYPSARMFDTMSVWGDMFSNRLPDNMPMIQWILIALIFDIMAFLLFTFAKLI